MKTLTMAAVVLALIAVPALAQMGGKRHKGDDSKTEQKKPQVDDKAYQAAEAHDLKSVAEVSDHLDGICASCHRHYGLE